MPVGDGAGHPAGAAAGNGSAGGQQGAVTPEQLTAFRDELLRDLNNSISGAITARVARFETQLPGLIAQHLAGTQTPAAAPAAAAPKGGSDPKDTSDLRAAFERAQKEAAEARRELLERDKAAAIREALATAGCKNVRLAMPHLAGRADIKPVRDPTTGETTFVATIKDGIGEREVPITEAVTAFLRQNPELLPPSGGGGSGALGARTNGHFAGAKDPKEMTQAEIDALPPADFERLVQAQVGSTRLRGGF